MRAARNNQMLPALLLATVSLLSVCQGWETTPKKGRVSKEAIAHVQCEVCELLAESVSSYAKEHAIHDEDGIADMLEGACSVKKLEGRWVSTLDIVRKDSDAQLSVVRQETPGYCRQECLIVQRACEASLKNKEEDLTSMLLQGKTVQDMKKSMCKKLCKKAAPKLAEWKDEVFEARDVKEMETEDMMAKMKAETGMGMKMYKREDMLSMSEGDMEIMAAKEALAQERAAARMENQEL